MRVIAGERDWRLEYGGCVPRACLGEEREARVYGLHALRGEMARELEQLDV